jgi:hypothetical protein
VVGRRLIKEGILTKVCRKDNKKRMFFLFDDSLLYGAIVTVGVTSHYKYGLMISFADGKARVKDLRDTHEVKHGFQIISGEKSFTVFAETNDDKNNWLKNFDMVLKGNANSGKCVGCSIEILILSITAASFIYNKSIIKEDVVKNNNDQLSTPEDQAAAVSLSLAQSTIDTDEAPVWIPDSQSKMCMICGSHFSVVKRRVSVIIF